MQIQIVKREDIDIKSWNKCIDNSTNRRIYAKSWYLDSVCNMQWEALVYNNYEAVMPLPFTKKAGVKFYIQPMFCQQLGIFWQGRARKELIAEFLKSLPGKFHKICMTADIAYYFEANQADFKPNYTIPFSCEYEDMLKIMSNNHKRNIRKAEKSDLSYREISPDEYISMKKLSGTNLPTKVWETLRDLLVSAIENSSMSISGAFLKDELVSAVCWLQDYNRIVYLQAASNESGKKTAAAFGLIDQMLKAHEKCGGKLDFEGSTNEGVARFYRGFGAKNETYPCIESQWMKKLSKFI